MTRRGDPALEAVQALGLSPPARVGVATSGGPDSLAALALLARVGAARGVPVVALHVEHGLRPEAAAAERALVENVARQVGATFAARRVDVASARDRDGGSVEFVARELRHRALDAMAAEHGLTHVVFAHHREDQVETVLLSILRGAWPGALAGIPASRPMPGGAVAVRPFLAVPRAALRAHSAPLAPASDPTNLDRRHRRVAVREDLLPALKAAAPAVDETILAIAEDARVLDAAASRAAAAILEGAYREPGVAIASSGVLDSAGWFARARLLRRITEDDPAFGHATWSLLDALGRACAPGARLAEEVRRGVRLTGRDGVVALFADASPAPVSMRWNGAPVSLPFDAVRKLRIEPLAGAPPAASARSVLLALDPGAMIEVRPRKARDRFPLGAAGHKVVADELSDRKVQPVWRPRIPLVLVDGELRWIAGVRVIAPTEPRAPNAVATLEGPIPW
jgi:tRNA(Ile)-lysidine synthetase-like protein